MPFDLSSYGQVVDGLSQARDNVVYKSDELNRKGMFIVLRTACPPISLREFEVETSSSLPNDAQGTATLPKKQGFIFQPS